MSVYVERLDPPRRVEEITTYQSAIDFVGSFGDMIKILDDERCWIDAPSHLDLVSMLKHCKSIGHRVIIITNNPSYLGRVMTIHWLKIRGVLDCDLHFTKDKLEIPFDAIVEDDPAMAKKCAIAGRLAFMVRRPWTVRVRSLWNVVRLPADEEAFEVFFDRLNDWKATG